MRAELARLDHDTERARAHTESALATTERLRSLYYAVELLVDQASYERQYGEMDAATRYVQRLGWRQICALPRFRS